MAIEEAREMDAFALTRLNVPLWSVGLGAAAFWLLQRALRRHVRLWALLTLPATALHELAHAAIGWATGAEPSSFTLWPRRVSATSWRLGAVGFLNLRWWNGGAVALAPLVWLLLIVALARSAFAYFPQLPATVPLPWALAASVTLVWLWIAVAPGRTDWALAWRYWPSALIYLGVWTLLLFSLCIPMASARP